MRIPKWIVLAVGILLILAAYSPATPAPGETRHAGIARTGAREAAPPRAVDEKTARQETERIASATWKNRRMRSLVVGVLQNNKVVVEKAYGQDPLYGFGQNDKSVPFALAQASEVLTGYAALLLAGQGKLSLADPAGKYLPTLPESWRAITVEQFLIHRSGIPDLSRNETSLAAALEQAGKAPLLFAPGTGIHSTPSDFDVLGQVIQAASHQPYMKFMNDSVFKPLKMSSFGDSSALVARHGMSAAESIVRGPSQDRTTNVAAGNTRSGSSDPEFRRALMKSLEGVLPEYSIPSEGLAANMEDVLKLFSLLSSDSIPGMPSSPAYPTVAPGWEVCHSGDDLLLMTRDLNVVGFGVTLDLLPKRKSGLALLWKLDPGADIELPAGERAEILEKALGVNVADWSCPAPLLKSAQ